MSVPRPSKGEGPVGISARDYCKSPDVKSAAEFVRMMNPPGLKKRHQFPVSPDIIVYSLVVIIMLGTLFLNIRTGNDWVEVRRTIIEKPFIEEDVEVNTGIVPSDGAMTPEDWMELSLQTPCDGIAFFYSGDGFLSDWGKLLSLYERIYSANVGEPTRIKPPSDMFANSTGYDCEDVAHATRCLGGLYNVTCKFWVSESIGEVVPRSGNHLGACCDVGGWKCI